MDEYLAPIKQRILQYVDYKQYKRGDFFSKLEIAASNFRSKSLKSEVGGEAIAKISSFYSDINSDWLLSGTGNMLDWDKKQSYRDGGEEVCQRLSLYFATKGIGISDANSMCGWRKGLLQLSLDKKKVSASHLFLITRTFSDLNPQWLMVADTEQMTCLPVEIQASKENQDTSALENEIKALKMKIDELESQNALLKQNSDNQQDLISFLKLQQQAPKVAMKTEVEK